MLFFFKQKTAYEMRISDWSSDVCSSDLLLQQLIAGGGHKASGVKRMGDNFAAEAATFASEAIGRWRQYLQFSGGEQLFKHGGRMFHVGEVDAAFVRRTIVTQPLKLLQPLDQCFAGTQPQHFAGKTDYN